MNNSDHRWWKDLGDKLSMSVLGWDYRDRCLFELPSGRTVEIKKELAELLKSRLKS